MIKTKTIIFTITTTSLNLLLSGCYSYHHKVDTSAEFLNKSERQHVEHLKIEPIDLIYSWESLGYNPFKTPLVPDKYEGSFIPRKENIQSVTDYTKLGINDLEHNIMCAALNPSLSDNRLSYVSNLLVIKDPSLSKINASRIAFKWMKDTVYITYHIPHNQLLSYSRYCVKDSVTIHYDSIVSRMLKISY